MWQEKKEDLGGKRKEETEKGKREEIKKNTVHGFCVHIRKGGALVTV